jgi:hypothetical protein
MSAVAFTLECRNSIWANFKLPVLSFTMLLAETTCGAQKPHSVP